MLPQQLPFDMLSSVPWDSPATWVVIGVGAAGAALLVLRRIRRMVFFATILGVIGLVAWNSGVLPPTS